MAGGEVTGRPVVDVMAELEAAEEAAGAAAREARRALRRERRAPGRMEIRPWSVAGQGGSPAAAAARPVMLFVARRTAMRKPIRESPAAAGTRAERTAAAGVTGPPSARVAARIEAREAEPPSVLHDLTNLDVALYNAIAATPTPTLDEPLRRLSDLASHSKLWLLIAGIMSAFGGRSGRHAALTGVAAIGVNSVVVNLPIKLGAQRARPDRVAAHVPETRHVPMPTSPSFPSGHAASAFAFTEAVAMTMPALAQPLRAVAYAVGYSRVHTGVHYPGDVIIGSLIGTAIGESVALAARRRSERFSRRRSEV